MAKAMGHVLRGLPSGRRGGRGCGKQARCRCGQEAQAPNGPPPSRTSPRGGQTGQLFFRRYEPDQVQRVRCFTISAPARSTSRGTPRSDAKCSRKREVFANPGDEGALTSAAQTCARTKRSASLRHLGGGLHDAFPPDRFPRLRELFGGAWLGWHGRLRLAHAAHGRRAGLTRRRRTEPGQQQSERDDGEGGAHGWDGRAMKRRRQPSVGPPCPQTPPGTRGVAPHARVFKGLGFARGCRVLSCGEP